MSGEILTVLILLAGSLVLFASEWLTVDLVAIIIVLTLTLTGLLDIHDALAGFGHPAVIGVGALFIVSEGLLRTGALGVVANRLERWSRGEENRLLILVLVIVLVSSAFLNNTPVVAMFIPVVVGICLRRGINPSRLLMPLSYAAILGGTCTLIGTSTNILVASIVSEHEGLRPLGMFEFSGLGLLLSVSGLVYLFFFARRLIPERQTITSMTAGEGDHRLREYSTEIEVRAGGSLAGRKFRESAIAAAEGVRVLQVIRGEEIIWAPFDDLVLEGGDALIISGRIDDLIEIQRERGLATLEEILSDSDASLASRETELAEILVQTNSPYAGQTLAESEFRRRFGIQVIAIQRHGMHLRAKLSEHPLRVGDLLLVQGSREGLERIRGEEGLVLLSGIEDVVVRRAKAPLAGAILLGVILLLALQQFHMATVALLGALLMIVRGCLPRGKVYPSIHWRILVLIAGTLALGRAMEDTGAAAWLAGGLISGLEWLGPRGLVVMMLVLSALLTECISNNAVAAVMIPVALQMATRVDVDGAAASPYPFIMAVAYGASCSFLTPIGYQTNTLVYGAGGYRFRDFARVGIPLVLIVWTVGGLMIPVFWPL